VSITTTRRLILTLGKELAGILDLKLSTQETSGQEYQRIRKKTKNKKNYPILICRYYSEEIIFSH
jgi:hypothetical protein